MGVPQILVIALTIGGLLMEGMLHGRPRIGRHNFFISLGSNFIIILLLLWGGFFGD